MKKNKLGLKVASKKEAFWIGIKNQCELAISNCENEIMVQKEMLKIAKNKILLEKRK